jgi:hypothetical protein
MLCSLVEFSLHGFAFNLEVGGALNLDLLHMDKLKSIDISLQNFSYYTIYDKEGKCQDTKIIHPEDKDAGTYHNCYAICCSLYYA